MAKKEVKNCWEYFDCPKEIKDKCEVYKSDCGDCCWMLGDVKKECFASKKYGSCFNCPWYKKHNKS